MIWIEHDMQMVTDLADRIHVLDYGRTIADGSPATVLNEPEVLRAYIGTAEIPATCPFLMLWTAPPPALRCHQSGCC